MFTSLSALTLAGRGLPQPARCFRSWKAIVYCFHSGVSSMLTLKWLKQAEHTPPLGWVFASARETRIFFSAVGAPPLALKEKATYLDASYDSPWPLMKFIPSSIPQA